MPAPFLSIIVPTYNGARYLPEALGSVAREPTDGLEILVADDGSTDETLEVVHACAARLPLRIVGSTRLGNWAATTNLALGEARAAHACFLHQDDLWLSGRVAWAKRALARDPRAALLLGPAVLVGPRGDRLGLWRCPLPAGRSIPSEKFLEHLLVQNFIAIPSPIFPVEAARRGGGLDPARWYTADWDLWLRLGGNGPVWYDSTPVVAFRVHEDSQTMARSRSGSEFRDQLLATLGQHLGDWSSRASPGRSRAVRRAAELSVELNAALAGADRGEPLPWRLLARSVLRLGPAGLRRYLRDSRLLERLLPRVRLRLSRR